MAAEYTATVTPPPNTAARRFAGRRGDPADGGQSAAARRRAAAHVARFGTEGMALLTLKDGMRYWFGEGGCVAYVDTGNAWVAGGSPLGPDERIGQIGLAFVDAARRAGRRAVFFGTERPFGCGELAAMKIGEQAVWDPRRWPATLAERRRMREQIRRARAKGVRVRALQARELSDGDAGQSVRDLVDGWLAEKGLAPMGFLLRPEPLAWPEVRRYLLAERGGEAVACLIAVPAPARRGFLVEVTARLASAPNGTTELLVDAWMRMAAAEGAEWVSLGLVPLSGGAPRWMKRVGLLTRWLYDFEGLRSFRSRMRPHGWEGMYLLHERGTSSMAAVMEVLRAFAWGSFLTFGVRTAAKHPRACAGVAGLLGLGGVAVAIALYAA